MSTRELERLVEASGFPFELAVAQEFRRLGFEIYPSHRFLDRGREREAELDLLAIQRHQLETKNGKKVEGTLRIAVESKDNSLPFVLFGLENQKLPDPQLVDSDSVYCHIQTSRDAGMGNRFTWVSLDDSMSISGWSKAQHHQLAETERFYVATSLSKSGSRYKLHMTENLLASLSKLGAFADTLNDNWSRVSKDREMLEERGSLLVFITLFLLVHSGQHYRWTASEGQLKEAVHTTVFMSHHAPNTAVQYPVDFVHVKSLGSAVAAITQTFLALCGHIVPIAFASPVR